MNSLPTLPWKQLFGAGGAQANPIYPGAGLKTVAPVGIECGLAEASRLDSAEAEIKARRLRLSGRLLGRRAALGNSPRGRVCLI